MKSNFISWTRLYNIIIISSLFLSYIYFLDLMCYLQRLLGFSCYHVNAPCFILSQIFVNAYKCHVCVIVSLFLKYSCVEFIDLLYTHCKIYFGKNSFKNSFQYEFIYMYILWCYGVRPWGHCFWANRLGIVLEG